MDKPIRLSQVSSPRQHLVRLCQSINYGSLHDLPVENSEPVLVPQTLIVLVDVRLDSVEHGREELGIDDFTLCAEVARLMLLLDQIENGTISRIEVRAGIPRRITLKKHLKEFACCEAGRI